MRHHVVLVTALSWLVAAVVSVVAVYAGQTQKGWVPARIPDGHPDLQGVWDFRTATPLERPPEFAGQEF